MVACVTSHCTVKIYDNFQWTGTLRIICLVSHCINGSVFSLKVDLGGLVVSVLATGPKVRWFDPDRGRWIFKGDKNPEHHFLLRGSKAVGPMS
jgi:hypothetical protein